MNRVLVGGFLLAALLATTTAASTQTDLREGSRGSLPDGEIDRDVEIPRGFPGAARAMPLPRLEPGDLRALPFVDPAELERSFGTVTRHSSGKITRGEAAPEVLEALRRKRSGVSPNSAPHQQPDPLFSAEEADRAVVGTDDRIRVWDSTSYPFRTIGYLWRGRSGCSATLIGPRTVLTAAHCVYEHENGGWKSTITFYPGANGDGNFPYRGYDWSNVTVLSGYISNWTGSYRSVMFWDLAVVTLKDAAGDRLGTLGFDVNTGEDFRAYTIGYPADKPFATMWRATCDVSAQQFTNTVYVHHCDSYGGSSGSSMYRYEKRGSTELRYVEGVNIAESDTGNPYTSYNRGILLTLEYFRWVKNLRQ